jgi:hypothetical protein
MGIIDVLFSSEWVSMLFIVMLVAISAKIFVLPKSFEKEQGTRIVLMKRQEERRHAQANMYR